MNGFLSVCKPRGPTSFDIVARVRRVLGTKRVGHAGTLDPDASGVLVIALGACTRLLEYLPCEPKVYLFGIRFGLATDTLDTQGVVTATGGKVPQIDALQNAVEQFVGEIDQVPPDYSSVKVNGNRAYRLARNGVKPQLKARTVSISRLDIVSYDAVAGEATLRVVCGSGTYVRALVRDIAANLDTLAIASHIHREAVGPFDLSGALPFERIDDAANYIIPAREAFRDYRSVQISAAVCDKIRHGQCVCGQELACSEGTAPGDLLFAFDDRHALIAVLRAVADQKFQPEKVLAT